MAKIEAGIGNSQLPNFGPCSSELSHNPPSNIHTNARCVTPGAYVYMMCVVIVWGAAVGQRKRKKGRPLKALLRKVFLADKKESGPSLPTEPISPAFTRAVRHESL